MLFHQVRRVHLLHAVGSAAVSRDMCRILQHVSPNENLNLHQLRLVGVPKHDTVLAICVRRGTHPQLD